MLNGKTILITGASSGFGKACAEQCAALGARLIITARRKDRLEQLAQALTANHKTEVLVVELDVQDNNQVKAAIESLPAHWQDIDVLINNAGIGVDTLPVQTGKPEEWDVAIDTNVKGLLYLTRAILPRMIERNTGHVINIGSTAGHDYYGGGAVYCATKHAVHAITRCLRLDLAGTPIRVSEIAPGAANTEFSTVRWKDKQRADAFYEGFTPLSADDVARSIVFCLIQPAHVNIAEIILFPTAQASVHVISRKGEAPKTGLFR